MKDKYTHIFEPLTVRTMTIKNRICMMPMGTNYGEQNDNLLKMSLSQKKVRKNKAVTPDSSPYKQLSFGLENENQ